MSFGRAVVLYCAQCRKVGGKLEERKMADLPEERLMCVGLDVSGPRTVASCCTSGRQVQSKRRALLFTRMSIRAVHIEVIESMDTSRTINAFRGLCSIRWLSTAFLSGRSLVDECKEVQMTSADTGHTTIERYLRDQGCTWDELFSYRVQFLLHHHKYAAKCSTHVGED